MEGYLLPFWSEACLLFILGAVLGSFLNVVALNLEDWSGWVTRKHSHCPDCEEELRWYELIPLFSYLIQAGRCRHCKKAISRTYFLVELGMGLALVGLYVWASPLYSIWQLMGAIVILSLWLVILLYDARTMSLSDWLMGITLVATILWKASFGWPALLSGLIGAVVMAVVLLVIRLLGSWLAKQEAMGLFDSVIGLLVGLLVGWPAAGVALFSAFIIGSVYGLLIAWRRHQPLAKAEVPFAPALLLGGYVALLYAPAIYNWYAGLMI